MVAKQPEVAILVASVAEGLWRHSGTDEVVEPILISHNTSEGTVEADANIVVGTSWGITSKAKAGVIDCDFHSRCQFSFSNLKLWHSGVNQTWFACAATRQVHAVMNRIRPCLLG